MVKIRKKSFIGQLSAVILIVIWIWIQEEFNLSNGKAFLVALILVLFILIIFSILSNQISGQKNSYDTQDFEFEERKKLELKISKLSDSEDKKNLLINYSKNIQFSLYDLRLLSISCKIDDDEFWIDLFVKNIKEIQKTRTNLIDFDGYLSKLSSNESRTKLKQILISKGILTDEKLWW